MRAAWPDEPMRCEVLPEGTTDDQIFAADLQKYNEMGWKRIVPTFGVDVRGRPTRCTLPQVYALIKLKAILAAHTGLRATNTVKARPISPHTKILLKYVFNRMATAYHFALTKNQYTAHHPNVDYGRVPRATAWRTCGTPGAALCHGWWQTQISTRNLRPGRYVYEHYNAADE